MMNSSFEDFFRIIYEEVFELAAPKDLIKLHSNKGMTDRVVILKKNLNKIKFFAPERFPGKFEKIVHSIILEAFSMISLNNEETISWGESNLCKSLEVFFSNSNKRFEKSYGINLSKYGYLINGE